MNEPFSRPAPRRDGEAGSLVTTPTAWPAAKPAPAMASGRSAASWRAAHRSGGIIAELDELGCRPS